MPIKQCGCTCDSKKNTAAAKFQDRKYGHGMRVYTTAPSGKKSRCTVCGKQIVN